MARTAKAKTKVKVNFKGVESRRTPDEGDYLMSVVEAKMGKSGNQNDQIEMTAEIKEGEYKGVKGYMYFPLTENSLWKLHAFMEATEQDVVEDEMDIDLSDWVGCEFVGIMSHETYQGKKRAKLSDFDTAKNYESKEGGKKKKKKDKDADADEGKKSKDKKKSKDDDADAKDKKDKSKDKSEKGGKDKKGDKGKKVKKLDADDVKDMDEDELKALIKEHKLDVKAKDFPKLKKLVNAVLEALEEADLLDD